MPQQLRGRLRTSRALIDEARVAGRPLPRELAPLAMAVFPRCLSPMWRGTAWTGPSSSSSEHQGRARPVLFQDPTSQVLAHMLTKCLEEILRTSPTTRSVPPSPTVLDWRRRARPLRGLQPQDAHPHAEGVQTMRGMAEGEWYRGCESGSV